MNHQDIEPTLATPPMAEDVAASARETAARVMACASGSLSLGDSPEVVRAKEKLGAALAKFRETAAALQVAYQELSAIPVSRATRYARTKARRRRDAALAQDVSAETNVAVLELELALAQDPNSDALTPLPGDEIHVRHAKKHVAAKRAGHADPISAERAGYSFAKAANETAAKSTSRRP